MNEIVVNERFTIGGGRPFVLIAGPCVIENETMVMHTAETLKRICNDLNINMIDRKSVV